MCCIFSLTSLLAACFLFISVDVKELLLLLLLLLLHIWSFFVHAITCKSLKGTNLLKPSIPLPSSTVCAFRFYNF
jgi:hypothetical protein